MRPGEGLRSLGLDQLDIGTSRAVESEARTLERVVNRLFELQPGKALRVGVYVTDDIADVVQPHQSAAPPSTRTTSPVMNRAAGEMRNSMHSTTASTVAIPSGADLAR